MELTTWIDILLEEFPGLLECLKSNTFPVSFLTRVFAWNQATVDKLPTYLAAWIGIYFLCGVITLVLRFKKGQKSLSSTANQINNVILTWCCTLFIPILILLVKICQYVLRTIEPYQGTEDFLRFLGQSFGSIFYPVLALAGVGFTVWMPISSFLRYLRVYQLGGLPHGIFDVGTGPMLLAVLLLSAAYGRRELYLLMALAVVLLGIVQRGRYVPDARNVQAATTRGVSDELQK